MVIDRRRLTAVAVACLAALVDGTFASLAAQAPLTFEPHIVQGYDGRDQQAQLGRLWVPESRSRRPTSAPETDSAGWVRLAFIRLASSSERPGTPIVFLMGGPGIPASVIARVPVYRNLFDRLRAAGDVILLDQRGVGLSTPALLCPPATFPIPRDFAETGEKFTRTYRELLAQCATHWRARGVDPRAYTVDAIADDLEDLRRALGVNRISLLGFSYGTHIALNVVARHPASVDRLVLAAALGPDHAVRLPSAFDESFRAVARVAAADSTVAGQTPDLEHALRAVLDSTQRQLLSVPIRATNGDSVTLTVGREGLQMLVSGRLGDRRLPALITSLSRGDRGVLARLLETVYRDLQNGAGTLMARAVVCSSPGSEARARRAATEERTSLLGRPIENAFLSAAFCDALGGARPARAEWDRVGSSRPALFITGTLDDRTPPSNVEEIARSFESARHVIVENGGHETLPADVVQSLVVDFCLDKAVASGRLVVRPPQFASVEEAKLPPRPPGR